MYTEKRFEETKELLKTLIGFPARRKNLQNT